VTYIYQILSINIVSLYKITSFITSYQKT